jgi:CMP-N-acetylneuraminic acid synthetase
MKDGKTVLALIPARGGSKGIPHKNIVPLGGKPLLAHSIDAVSNHPLIDRIAVSTDDPLIAEVAREYGAEVPFLRPREISGDRCTLKDVISHAIQLFEQDTPIGALVLLYPTSPFRSRRLLDNCLVPVLEGRAVSVTTVVPVQVGEALPAHVVNGRIQVFSTPVPANALWQSMGSVTVLNRTGMHEGAWPHRNLVVPLEDPVERIDIDTPEDLRLAERILDLGLWESAEECGRVA